MVERQFSPDDLPSVHPDVRRSLRRPPPIPPPLEWRIFRGVFYALLAFSLLSTIGYGVRVLLVAAWAGHVQQQVVQQAQQAMQENAQRQRAWQEHQAELAAYEQSRRLLAVNQRCVGGAVVQVDGTTYTQLGSISQPVHCTGRLADRPLR